MEEKITEERKAKDYLYELLRASGEELVKAVKIALEELGFTEVINSDRELEEEGNNVPKREDLRIHDDSPVVLVEVKGISGLPRDADALQVQKYFVPRMREWGRTDIRGLEIINHQKNLPSLERNNETPFRDDILTNAEENDFGLMTTWDLFRLVRSFLSNGWQHEHVKNLFHKNGRIEPIPEHYQEIGVVEHIWPQPEAVGVRLHNHAIHSGDTISFEFPVEFKEQTIESLEEDNQPVEVVEAGDLAGIQTSLIDQGLQKGMKVYKVK